jgi:hypothetical protein
MDDIVKQALAKWPNVPNCYGWLALDNRGDWYMRDDRIQAQGLFPHPKGSRLTHEKLIAFIARNYEADESGQWYFQNGPQRVYVELETSPWVWRIESLSDHQSGTVRVVSHTGVPAQFKAAYQDEQGHLLLHTDLGLGLVHTQDVLLASHMVELGQWQPQAIASTALEAQFAFVKSPQHQRVQATTSPTI